MSLLISAIVTLIIIGLILWLIETLLPIDPWIKRVIQVLIIVFVLIWLLSMLGGYGPDLGTWPNRR